MRNATNTRLASRRRYVERVNLAIDHIVGHLAEPLRLVAVARAADLSAFHFHRVFQALVGETVAEFVKRLRLERALTMMALPPRRSLTQIGLACGFSSSSDFSRCFRQRYGLSPSRFDVGRWRDANRSRLRASLDEAAARMHLAGLPAGDGADGFRARIRELPARTVAYVRVHDPYQSDAVTRAAAHLVAWAERRGLASGQWLGYQWENPEIVPLEQCRYHVAVTAEGFSARGAVGRYRFPAMVVAEVEVRGPIALELRALQWLYGTWLPRSGYVPDDQPCFEAWIGRPFAHGVEHFELRVQLPVRRG
ncbi:MAG: helix-turn-helix domain-containing protein [Phycisphaerae bacterium]